MSETSKNATLPEPIRAVPYAPGAPDVPVVPPVSAAKKAAVDLQKERDAGGIHLNDELITLIAQAAVEPSEMKSSPVRPVRVKSGFLYLKRLRVFVPMVDGYAANDRLLAQAWFAASPDAPHDAGTVTAIARPRAFDGEALLVQDGDADEVLAAATAAAAAVRRSNPQAVGARGIEQPVTLVPIHYTGMNSFALTSSDGSSRINAAQNNIRVEASMLPARLDVGSGKGADVPLSPEILGRLSAEERRSLCRSVAKAAQKRLAKPPVAETGSWDARRRDLEERNAAAEAANSLTAPADIMVGFVADSGDADAFPRLLRQYLEAQNVEPTPFDEGAKSAVSAEEIVADLAELGMIDGHQATVLLGRVPVAEAMNALDLDPRFPDQRAALVMNVLTGNDDEVRRVMRARLSIPRVNVRDRVGPIGELAMRSYGALKDPTSRQMRLALEAGCVWPGLISTDWSVPRLSADHDVDSLADQAKADPPGGPCRQLLGVVGMFALMSSGALLAPAGSAQREGGPKIDRGRPASIVERMIEKDWGIDHLADSIKRARKGLRPRTIGADGGLVEAQHASEVNVRLRERVNIPDTIAATPEAQQAVLLSELATAVNDTINLCMQLDGLRHEHQLTGLLARADTQTLREQLSKAQEFLRQITVEEQVSF